jgi:hypothetical protein
VLARGTRMLPEYRKLWKVLESLEFVGKLSIGSKIPEYVILFLDPTQVPLNLFYNEILSTFIFSYPKFLWYLENRKFKNSNYAVLFFDSKLPNEIAV